MNRTPQMLWRALFVSCLSICVLLNGCGGGAASSASGGGNSGGGNGGGGNGGGTWVAIQTQPPNIVDATFLMIDQQGNFYLSGENGTGMFFSSDHGTSWNQLNNGFVNACHQAMLVNGLGEALAGDDTNTGVASCSSLPNHLYHLSGGNTSWSQATPGFGGFGQRPYQLLGSGSGARIVAGGLNGSVWISDDNGDTYQQCSGCAGVFSSTTTAETLDIKTGPGGYLYVATALSGVYYSTDNGNTWTQMPCNGGNNCAGGTGIAEDNMALGVTPSGSLLVSRDYDSGSVACYGPQPPPNGTWTRCDTGLAPGSGGHPNAVLSQTGGFWLNTSHTVVFLAANNGNSHIGDVYSSTDGADWTRYDSGLPAQPNAINFSQDPTTGFLYVLVKGSGIYHTTQAP